MKKQITIIVLILAICFMNLQIYQAGSYRKVLTGKINYQSRLFGTSIQSTKIGHYEVDGKNYNLKFIHPNVWASGLNCPSVQINEDQIGGCNFKSIELYNNKYFIIYYEFYAKNAGYVYDLEIKPLGKVMYNGFLTGEEIIVKYEKGEYEEIKDYSEYLN